MSESSKLTDELVKKLESLKVEFNVTNRSQIIEILVKKYEEMKDAKPDFTEEQNALIENALSISGLRYKDLVKKGLIAESKRINSNAKHLENISEKTDEEKKRMTVGGLAKSRIEDAINVIKQHNNTCPENKDRYCITTTLVFKLTGSNRGSINEYFEQHNDEIVSHNGKYGLQPTDNRKGIGKDPKDVLGFN